MIRLHGVSKTYPAPDGRHLVRVLDKLDLAVARNEFVSVLGPSGCGKTTLLRIVAGLTPPDSGAVLVNGRPVQGPGPDRGMVFQDFALLPWATVAENIAFGLELRGFDRTTRLATAAALTEAVGLRGFSDYYPHQLSGGMQQRVGLARALAVNPDILLLDEPFGSVDALTRRLLQEDLLRLHAETPKTVLLVTHSVDEAVRLGDRIVLLGPRPAQVLEVVATDLPRPRPAHLGADARFIELKEHLWARLKSLPGLTDEPRATPERREPTRD
jgi:ABC-type nitrate/sulfonate/bicarbonate transport system ATPase subunit